jgi:cysteine desulfurase
MPDIYLDHAATTPLDPQVLEAMLPYLTQFYGNPSSIHSFGRDARVAIDRARGTIARQLSCTPSELVFTSGGTESNNAAIHSAVVHAKQQGNVNPHIITTQVEHLAILDACRYWEMQGCEVTYVPVDTFGSVNPEDILMSIRPHTALITVMAVNNEVGTLQPIEAIGRLAKESGILFHVDGVQALGKIPLDLSAMPVDTMSLSAHKIYGPKGVGVLYMSRNIPFTPMLHGGSQERKRRAGTENTAGIVGFAEAVRIFVEQTTVLSEKAASLRKLFIGQLISQLGEDRMVINSHESKVLPHILNVSFPGIDTETLLMNLDLSGVAAASGSACSSGSLEVSHVLKAMNLPDEVTQSAVRFSFGAKNTAEEIIEAATKTATIYRTVRI